MSLCIQAIGEVASPSLRHCCVAAGAFRARCTSAAVHLARCTFGVHCNCCPGEGHLLEGDNPSSFEGVAAVEAGTGRILGVGELLLEHPDASEGAALLELPGAATEELLYHSTA